MGSFAIADLGRQADGALAPALLARLVSADLVLVPSSRGAAASVMAAAGIPFTPYDEAGLSAAAPAAELVEALGSLSADRDVVLALAGYPFLREGVVAGLLRRRGSFDVLPADSPLEVLLLAFDIDETADLDLVDAAALKAAAPERGSHLVITGIANAIAARTASKRLVELYPPDHPVVVASAAAPGAYMLRMGSVGSLASGDVRWPDSAVYVPPVRIAPPSGFDELVRIMAVLRGPDGCPWDHEQTHMTLRKHMLEEAYEAVAAIEAGDDAGLADELGDILLQVVFHAQIAADEGRFTIADPIALINAKLRRRHPHIFGDATADTPAEVMARWDAIKREERASKAASAPGGEGAPAPGILDGIAPTLPALSYAEKMSRRAVAVGFEWETVDDVWEKVHEEIAELQDTEPGSDEAVDEVGDLLFTVVNVARKMDVDAETALRMACEKFRRRFTEMERVAAEQGRELDGMGIDEMEALWRLAKEGEGR